MIHAKLRLEKTRHTQKSVCLVNNCVYAYTRRVYKRLMSKMTFCRMFCLVCYLMCFLCARATAMPLANVNAPKRAPIKLSDVLGSDVWGVVRMCLCFGVLW